VLLYLDYGAPIERIRAKAEEIVAASKSWDRKVINVRVTDTRERVIEVRVLVSAANASAAFDLRCEMREKLIAFLRSEHPESLPRARIETVERQVENPGEVEADGRAAGARWRTRRNEPAGRPCSTLTPVASITVFHSCACSASAAAKSCAVPIFASRPSSARPVRTSADRRPSLTAALSAPTMAGGVPAGASSPNHTSVGKPLTPSSCMVGGSGSSGQRTLLVTASGRSLPLLKWTSSTDLALNTMSMWPPSRSVMAGAAPL